MTGTERKVFQKYYPPDFDPSKIPKAKGAKNRQFVQRVMTPFNMRCNTCSEFIYKGKKFNMRRETAEGESYLGLKIFRFYFRCPNCLAEITFKTDIQNVDYQAEHGATRLFDVYKFWQEQEQKIEAKEEEEKGDAMKMLEKRTKMSKLEMEALGDIEELQEANRRGEKIDTMGYLNNIDQKASLSMADQLRRQEEEDEREIQRLVGKTIDGKYERRLNDEDERLDAQQACSSSALKEEVASFVASTPSTSKATNFIVKPQLPSTSSSAFGSQVIKRPFGSQAKLLSGDRKSVV